jgi:hypothetical protein
MLPIKFLFILELRTKIYENMSSKLFNFTRGIPLEILSPYPQEKDKVYSKYNQDSKIKFNQMVY